MVNGTICKAFRGCHTILHYGVNISVKPGLPNSTSFNILKGFLTNTGMIIQSSDLWTGRACTGRQRGSRKKATLEENSQLALEWETSGHRKTSTVVQFYFTRTNSRREPNKIRIRHKDQGQVATSNTKRML